MPLLAAVCKNDPRPGRRKSLSPNTNISQAIRKNHPPATDIIRTGGNPKDGRKIKGTLHWVSEKHGVPAEVAARNAFVRLTHPEAGTHDYMTLPFRLSLTPGGQHRASPCLGADTRKVLLELAGLSPSEFDELEREGVTFNIPAA